jgi:hypothetical protein
METLIWEPEESRDEYVKRIAQNRYETRMNYGIKGNAESDWKYAEALVLKEEKKDLLKSKDVIEKLKAGGY